MLSNSHWPADDAEAMGVLALLTVAWASSVPLLSHKPT